MYIVGIGMAELIILIGQTVLSPSFEVDTAFLMRATFVGGSSRQHHVALQFSSQSLWRLI